MAQFIRKLNFIDPVEFLLLKTFDDYDAEGVESESHYTFAETVIISYPFVSKIF